MDFILFFFLSVRLPSTLRYTISNKSQWFVFLSPFQCCSPHTWASLQEEDLGQRQHLDSGWGIERALVQTNLWTLGLWLQSRALRGVVSQSARCLAITRLWLYHLFPKPTGAQHAKQRLRFAPYLCCCVVFIRLPLCLSMASPPRCHFCTLHLPPFKLWMTRCIHQRAGARFQ